MVDLGQDKARSKQKLKLEIKQRITEMFSSILDYTEVAVGDPDRYNALRGKILRVSNDTIRDVERMLDKEYTVEFIPTNDVVVIRPR